MQTHTWTDIEVSHISPKYSKNKLANAKYKH